MSVSQFVDPFGIMQQGRNVDSQIAARDTGTAMNLMQMQQMADEMARQREYNRRVAQMQAQKQAPPPGAPQGQGPQTASDMIYSQIGQIDQQIKVASDLGLMSQIDRLNKQRDAMLSRYALAQQREEATKKRVQDQQKETTAAVGRFASSAADILDGDASPEDKVQQLKELDQAAKEENPDAYKVLSGGQGGINWADPRTANRMKALANQAIPPEKRAELAIKKSDEERKRARDEELKKEADVRAALTRELRDIERKRLEKPAAPKEPESVKGLQGEEYLAALPEDERGLVKGIADGRIDPKSLSMRKDASGTSERERVLKEVLRYRPGFNQAKFSVYQAVQKDFASGMASKNVTAINTAIGHMGTMDKMASALDNNDTKALNLVLNGIARQTGDPRMNNFEIAASAVSSELMRVFRQVGASETEQKDWEKKFSQISSPAQLHDAVKTAAALLKSRVSAVNRQWKRGMDTDEDYPKLLDPHSKAVLSRLGINTALEEDDSEPVKDKDGAISLDDYLKQQRKR